MESINVSAVLNEVWHPSYALVAVYAVAAPLLLRYKGRVPSTSPLWKPIMVSYNVCMSLFSLACFASMTWLLFDRLTPFTVDCGVAYREPLFKRIVWAFWMSKYVEFADTVFLIVKGKDVSWLHFFHHIGAAIDLGCLFQSEFEAAFIFVALNGFIHTIMYGYYACSLLGIRLRGKAFITTAQLIQFFTGFYILWGYRSITECHVGARAFTFWYNYVYVGFLVILFANFFVRSYIAPQKKKKKKKK